jgi:PAS domain S-box-containing protein
LARALQQGEVCPGEEVDIVTFDGQHKTILNAAAPIRDRRGIIVGGVVAEMDITERKRAEQALTEAKHATEMAEAWFRALVELAPDALIITDMQGHVLLVNHQTEVLFGYARTTLLGQPIERLLPERFHTRHQQHRAAYAAHPRTGPMGVGLELYGLRRDSSEFPVEVSLGSMATAGEGRLIAMCRDVTEPRRRERRVQAALQALLALGEALVLSAEFSGPPESPDDAGGTLTTPLRIDRFAQLIQGIFDCEVVQVGLLDPSTDRYTPLAIVGASPPDGTRERLRAVKGAYMSAYWTAEQRAEVHAGHVIVLNATTNPQYTVAFGSDRSSTLLAPLVQGEEVVGLLEVRFAQQDSPYGPETQALVGASARLAAIILEQERLVSQREEARAAVLALQETSRQMDAFLGMATHELKTPVTTMLLAVQFSQRRLQNLLRRDSTLPGAVAEHVADSVAQLIQLEVQAKKLDRLVNDLLDLTRFQAGKLQINRQPTDLRQITQQAVEEQRQVAPTRAIQLHLSDTHLSVPVLADADRIGQVIANYLTNALKYSLADRPVEVGLDLEESRARVWVHDQGPGLPKVERERVWQRYHRAPGIEVRSGAGIGLGLGLSICQEIIARHDGEVGVESTPGQGSTFWFTLPLATAPAA